MSEDFKIVRDSPTIFKCQNSAEIVAHQSSLTIS